MEHTRALSVDIGRRPSGSPGEERAAAYVEGALAAAGYEVVRQEFTRADGGVSRNVIGRARGVDYSSRYLVVGGHYDTFGESPGGNDNASGVGVVLALAEALAGRTVPVEFAAFAAEERHPVSKAHHEGSLAYVGALADPAVVEAMVSVDMVGNGTSVAIVRLRGYPDALQREIHAVANETGIPHRVLAKGDVSDHTSFARRGVPAVFLWSGDHPALHKAGDTFEVVQAPAVERAGRLALEWLRRRLGL